MSFTPPSAWLREARLAGSKPILVSRMLLPARRLLKVVDNAAAAGVIVRVRGALPNATGWTIFERQLVEGRDFNTGGTLAGTAGNLQAALNGALLNRSESLITTSGTTRFSAQGDGLAMLARRMAPGMIDVTGEGSTTSGGTAGYFVKVCWPEGSRRAEEAGADRDTVNTIEIIEAPDYESGLTADVTRTDTTTIAAGSLVRNADVYFTADVTFPSPIVGGIIWEQGSSSAGLYLGIVGGQLVLRAGDGGNSEQGDNVPAACARFNVDAGQFAGDRVLLHGWVDVSANEVHLWSQAVDGSGNPIEAPRKLGSAVAASAFPSGLWANTDGGAFTTQVGTAVGGEDNSTFTGTGHALRIYNSASAPADLQNDVVTAAGGIEIVSWSSEDRTFVSGDAPWKRTAASDGIYDPPMIGDASEVGQRLDPKSREFSGADLTLDLIDDSAHVFDRHPVKGGARGATEGVLGSSHAGRPIAGTFRQLHTEHPLPFRKIVVGLGFQEVPGLDNVVALGTYFVNDAKFEPGSIALDLGDALVITEEKKFKGSFYARHPLDVMREIAARAFGTQDDNPFDMSTFDPEEDTARSHFSISAAAAGDGETLIFPYGGGTLTGLSGALSSSESVRDLMHGLVRLMGGTLRPRGGTFASALPGAVLGIGEDPAGQLYFHPDQQGGSVVRTFDALTDLSEPEVVSTFGELSNAAVVGFGFNPLDEEARDQSFTLENEPSVRILGKRIEEEFDSRWLNAYANRGSIDGSNRTRGGLIGPHGGRGSSTAGATFWGSTQSTGFNHREFSASDVVLTIGRPAHGFSGARFVSNAGGTAVEVENTNGRLTTGGAVERRAFFRIWEDGGQLYRATGTLIDSGVSPDGSGEIIACKGSWHYYQPDFSPTRIPGAVEPVNFPDGTDSADVDRLDIMQERRGLPYEDLAKDLIAQIEETGVYAPSLTRELYEDAVGTDMLSNLVERRLAPAVVYEIDDEYDEDGFASGRGGFGTTTPELWGRNGGAPNAPSVIDYTIAVDLAKREVRRWAWGSFVFKAFAPLSAIGVECGDLTRVVNDDRLIGALDAFVDSNYVWEITGREIRILDDSPGVEFEFTIFRVDSFTFEIFRNIPTVTPEIPGVSTEEPEFIVDNALVDVYIDADSDGTLDTGVLRG